MRAIEQLLSKRVELFKVTVPSTPVVPNLFCDRASVPLCFSMLVHNVICPVEFIQLPGLFLLTDGLKALRQASIQYDDEYFVITGQASFPVEPFTAMQLAAVLGLDSDGDLIEFQLCSAKGTQLQTYGRPIVPQLAAMCRLE